LFVESQSHLSAGDIAAYVDGDLTSSESDRVEAHLAACDECRAEVVAVQRLVRTRPRVGRRLLLVPIGLAAAAAIVFALLARFPESSSTGRDVLRSDSVPSDAAPGARIDIIAPRDGDTVSVTRAKFAWRALARDATYRFTLADQSGRAVWTTTVSDTLVLLPAEVMLQPGTSYFWYVDALRADGRSASSGVHRIVVP